MAKLLVTVSGGTVSSSVKDGLVKLEKESPIASYLKGKAEETLFISPANYSSENARPEDYRDVLKAVSEAASAIRPDGILILHGTDTMAYFAQLAARALSHMSIPFVITGSKIPPDCEGTDAFSNIDFAVEQVTSGNSGVVFTTHEGSPAIVPAGKVTSPDIYMGDVIGDLNSRRGQVSGTDIRNGAAIISAEVPLASMFGYSTDLRSRTQGRANYSMEPHSYVELPKNLQEAVIGRFAR